MFRKLLLFSGLCGLSLATSYQLKAEAMLQYFNTDWAEITRKMPELAEAGYSSLWLPPPTKGSGGLSVGYDLWDPFDLGSKDQRNTVRTRYGTEAELLDLVKTAHRFGIRVYFDNIMNHRAFDIPGFNENTPIDIYPGMVPEDFHLRTTQEGFYRKWDNTRDWNSAWQVQNLGLADLIDIAQEPGTTNFNFGPSEGSTHPKIKLIRDLDRPEQYHFDKDYNYIGFGGLLDLARAPENLGAGASDAAAKAWAQQYLQDNASVYEEYVQDYLNRAARWLMDRTKADGLRLDAVKHIRADFFGATFGENKDLDGYGYLGQVQEQFNKTRGFSDLNHRDTVFDTEKPRDDAMVFGEHLGEPPGYGPYFDSGMRLVDNPLRQQFNDRLGSPWNGLNGFDSPGAGGFAPELTVMHAQSHDNDYAARRELQHAMYFTRAGIGLLYTDGNYQAETLGESGGAFPRHANTSFLGQWDDPRVPNLLHIHEQFARGYQQGKWSDGDIVVYERIDKREENGNMDDANGVTMLFMLNDNYSAGQSTHTSTGRNITTSFPSVPGGSDAYLYQYARGVEGSSQVGFYKWASDIVGNGDAQNALIIPPGQYFIFSWKNPDPSDLWANAGGRPITIYENGDEVDTVDVLRRDGPNGDADFFGDTLPDEGRPIISNEESDDFAYTASLPRVTDGTDLSFVARVDGSAENVLFRLDGGIDLNGTKPASTNVDLPNEDPVNRDNPPALSWDMFLGYEQPTFVHRIHPELFAAAETGARDTTGSTGAETFTRIIGDVDFTINQGSGTRFIDGDTAQFLYHDPEVAVTGDAGVSDNMYENDGSNITLWAKTNSVGGGYLMHVYYTTDGSFPEGAGGEGLGSTQVASMNFQHNDDGGDTDWWLSATIPSPANGETFRYKIGIYKEGAPSWFPASPGAVERKSKMLSQYEIDGFDATSVEYFPHYDYAKDPNDNLLTTTGLEEGFHIISARAFLKRDGQASIYNTFKQTFYYDTERPQGEIPFPENDGDSVGGSSYGVVVRTDATVDEVWYRIEDSDTTNDDSETGARNGNGVGFEPFTDSNQNGVHDPAEPYEDLNENGSYDAVLTENWVRATERTPNLSVEPSDPSYRKEWRFDYVNIPASTFGSADIKVRLREVSSAEYKDFTLNDNDGHFTTLTRNVNVDGPDERVFVAFPAQDREIVGDDYDMKVYFSKSLADGLSEQELIDRFLIRIGSTESGDPGQAQSREMYEINYDETDTYHALVFNFPNLYNDVPDYDHLVTVTLDQPPGEPDFVSTRIVRALPVTTPRVLIVNPPELGSDGRPFEIILPDIPSPAPEDRQFTIQVATNTDATDVTLNFVNLRSSNIGTPETSISGSSKLWDFPWSGITEGSYNFTATVTAPGGSASATRRTTVIFRETVEEDNDDTDDDDDGLLDGDENTPQELPEVNSDQWTNGDIHTYFAFGESNPTSPDTDGDGLPDGLEVGWRETTTADTDTAADSDGDGFFNFIGDLDPPFYNTLDNLGSVPGINNASEGGDRTRLVRGSVTDPTNPDTDNDGIPDGIEDTNRNGWVDGDGETLPTDFNPYLERDWPNGVIDPSETWTETDPNNRDTDGDGASDGYGEDKNFDGIIAGDTNANRVYDTGEEWSETDPLNSDTDGDGMPDGWEVNNGLDPLVSDGESLRTAVAGDGDPDNGATGDPDNDGFTNLQELVNGTRPLEDNTVPPPPANSIIIGPGANETVGNAENLNEFTDWTIDDLLVLDEYDGNGTNNQGSDIYKAYDGFDSSRDIVAFYFRDGGGDGKLYFRIDFHDLRPFAEEGNLDAYVVIDTGNTDIGESALPDEVDTRTEMKWEAIVALYETSSGAVYIDTAPGENTTVIGEDLFAKGVVRRDQASVNGFDKAYYNADLDAVEYSISRQALLDAGWNGDAESLNFQVFTTRDGTQNSPTPGAGDIGGRSDIRDTIYDDFLASAYFRDQSNIAGDKSVLRSWFSRSGSNDRGKRAKVAMLTHDNQAILPASDMHGRINDGAGAGYFRLIDAHESFDVPVNLHITPTLASALQWAAVDPAVNRPWRDGPTLNGRISGLLLSDNAMLFGTTFAGQVTPYASQSFTADSIAMADDVLSDIYSTPPSQNIFWPAERVLDDATLGDIANMGFTYAMADQMRHHFSWFGRTSALGEGGYRINQVNGIGLLPIHDFASGFLFQTEDNGLNIPLRELLSRRARSETQDQLLSLLADWGSFSTKAQADAYDTNLRWLANRPWIEIVSLEDVISGDVDLSEPADSTGDDWGVVDRGTGQTLEKTAKDYIDYATQGNYDNWYYGQPGREEGLFDKVFDIRSGISLPDNFGEIGSTGIADDAWTDVGTIASDVSGQGRLGRSTAHAAMFVTAFHDQPTADLRKFSTGDYINPDSGFNSLANFSKRAQAQMRFASIYQRVDVWSAAPPLTATAVQEDVDLDGEVEYLLYNETSFAVFEAIGGRCVAAFARKPSTGEVYQIIGTQPAYAGSANEEEGIANVVNGKPGSHRTSAFKDWFADGPGGGTSQYVNAVYTVTAAGANGWMFTAPGGHIVKTVTLPDDRSVLTGDYSLSGDVNKLYVRFGLSPDLWNLIRRGQYDLDNLEVDMGKRSLWLINRGEGDPVTASVSYDANAQYVASATDDEPGTTEWDALNMRNQALVHQTELTNAEGQSTFQISLALETSDSDNDNDGLPNWWERDAGLDLESELGDDGSTGNPDGDPYDNYDEYVLGLNPEVPEYDGLPRGTIAPTETGGFTVTFPLLAGRTYRVWYVDDLSEAWQPAGPAFTALADNPGYVWTDDGSATDPNPDEVQNRFYYIEITR
ncbi:alpha-amylase family glycosyl hydrolase [Coraliomargarita sinensis]|nr:alpha-amylase family glycosyl hydrolase [Coraliomargarita sinensis]